MVARLLAQRMQSACVRVLRDNPTRWFYRHLAGRLAPEETIRFAGISLPQQTYAWPDMSSLEHFAGPVDGWNGVAASRSWCESDPVFMHGRTVSLPAST